MLLAARISPQTTGETMTLPPTIITTTQTDAPVKIKGLTTRPHAPSQREGLRYAALVVIDIIVAVMITIGIWLDRWLGWWLD